MNGSQLSLAVAALVLLSFEAGGVASGRLSWAVGPSVAAPRVAAAMSAGDAQLSPDCPRLSSELRELLAAPDAAVFAVQRGLYYQQGRVRVEITLADVPENVAEVYGLETEASYRTMLQALAPLATLCDLANDPRVVAVRAPTPASPGGPGPGV